MKIFYLCFILNCFIKISNFTFIFFVFFTVFFIRNLMGLLSYGRRSPDEKKIDFSLFLFPFDFSRLNLYIAYSGQISR